MNRYHNLLQSNNIQDSEPRWVTQCLEGFGVNEKEKGRKIKQNKFKKIFEKLRHHSNKGSKSSSKAKEEAELRNEAQMLKTYVEKD